MEAFGGDSLERIDDSAPSSARHAAVQSFNAPPRQAAFPCLRPPLIADLTAVASPIHYFNI